MRDYLVWQLINLHFLYIGNNTIFILGKWFVTFGRNSVKAIIKRIIYKLFNDVLLSNFSFTGKKGKHKFCKLNLCSVIFGKNNLLVIYLL